MHGSGIDFQETARIGSEPRFEDHPRVLTYSAITLIVKCLNPTCSLGSRSVAIPHPVRHFGVCARAFLRRGNRRAVVAMVFLPR